MSTAIIIGRFQPITNAHYNIIKQAITTYNQTYVVIVNSKTSIAANVRRRQRALGSNLNKENDNDYWKKLKKQGKLSKSASPKKLENEIHKNPFSGALRAKMIYDSFNGKLHKSRIIQSPTANIESIINKILEITDEKQFVILCGSDREANYKNQIQSAIKNKYIPSDIKVSIKITPRDIDDADNISATKVRNAIKSNDFQTFKSLTPKGIWNYFDKLKKYLMTESQRSFFRQMLLEMTHIEDLKVNDFIDFVKNIYKTEASVKLDGTANLAFGISENNKFYTAFGRTSFHKNSTTPEEKRMYSVNDWLKQEKLYVNAAASAHAALEKVINDIKQVIKPGQEVSSEIMFGDKPNCIKYDFSGINHIVILNNKELADKLNKKNVHITVKNFVIESDNLSLKTVKQTWTFGKTQIVDPKKYDININTEIKELEDFLNATTDGFRNMDILGMRAAGKSKELVLKVRKKAQQLKLNVKEQLLKQFVRQVKEGSYIPSKGYSHEGIVLKNEKGNMTKIIDKDVFTSIHERDWKPAHEADTIVKQYKKGNITKQEAIKQINDKIKNFNKYYKNISDDMKDRMMNSLKMTLIDLRRNK